MFFSTPQQPSTNTQFWTLSFQHSSNTERILNFEHVLFNATTLTNAKFKHVPFNTQAIFHECSILYTFLSTLQQHWTNIQYWTRLFQYSSSITQILNFEHFLFNAPATFSEHTHTQIFLVKSPSHERFHAIEESDIIAPQKDTFEAALWPLRYTGRALQEQITTAYFQTNTASCEMQSY